MSQGVKCFGIYLVYCVVKLVVGIVILELTGFVVCCRWTYSKTELHLSTLTKMDPDFEQRLLHSQNGQLSPYSSVCVTWCT
jgi:hypothetical protein